MIQPSDILLILALIPSVALFGLLFIQGRRQAKRRPGNPVVYSPSHKPILDP